MFFLCFTRRSTTDWFSFDQNKDIMFRSCCSTRMVNRYRYGTMSDASHPACVQHGKPRMAVALGTNQYCQSAALCQGLDSDQCVLLALAWDLVRADIGRQSTPGSKSRRLRGPRRADVNWLEFVFRTELYPAFIACCLRSD